MNRLMRFDRRTTGLDRQPLEAKAFYGTIAVATVVGILINFVDIDPIWAAVLNSVVAVPLMVVVVIMAMQERIMGKFTLPRPLERRMMAS
jgi:Mn2+/Fe2+ NRAMP family transporter